MKIVTQAPCRVDLAGGTMDIWPLYLFHRNALTVNFAVDRYTHCMIETDSEPGIKLISLDLKRQEQFASLEELQSAKKYRLPLLAYLIDYFAPRQGFRMTTNSEAPAGAGISGSSSLIISIATALNKLTSSGHSIETIREIAQNNEARIIRVPTGCQDYYPAMYGEVSAIEMDCGGIRRRKIPVDLDDFNERIVLAYTGEPRNSGINNWEVNKAHIDGDAKVHRNFDRIAAIANAMRAALEKSDWLEVARLLREEWTQRKRNAPGITTPLIDRLVEVTRKSGARGAKVCGAGGGGCVFFLADRGAKQRVAAAIEAEGAVVLPVKVAPSGVRVRTSQ
ncbi:MAG: GHMP kinase [Candidatus Solibacter usitatus]|nr:GHMP kinase [Candidatus Solibacter usitatus]